MEEQSVAQQKPQALHLNLIRLRSSNKEKSDYSIDGTRGRKVASVKKEDTKAKDDTKRKGG